MRPHKERPRDEASEVAILAACMTNMQGDYAEFDDCAGGGISEASFLSFHHKLIWECMMRNRSEGRPIDEPSLFSLMQNASVGSLKSFAQNAHKEKKISEIVGFANLCEIVNNYSAHPLSGFIQSLKDKELLRASIQVGERLIESAMSGTFNGEEIKGKAEAELLFLTDQKGIKDTSVTASTLYCERVDKLLSGEASAETFTTGFPSIDAQLGPFPRKTNMIIGARPSTGKTTIGFQMAANMCMKHGLKGVMFSLESPASQIIDRAVALRSQIPLGRMKDGMLSASQKQTVLNSKKDVEKLGLLIDDGRGRTVYDIRSLARRYKKQHGLDFVLIDHFGRIRPTRSDRAAIEEISAELDDMKHELDCIVITLAQFSRSSEKEKRKPMMSDLRECGTLEQDADIILLLSRHEDEGVLDNTKRDLFCPKNRDGTAAWDVTLGFDGPIYRFRDSHRAAQMYQRRPEPEALSQGEIDENPFG